MELRNFINGKFIDSISKRNIPVLNPSNQDIVDGSGFPYPLSLCVSLAKVADSWSAA